MTYSTKTWFNTHPGRYYVRQTLSHWKNRQKSIRGHKTKAKLCHALSSSKTTILSLMLPQLGRRLCRRLQLSGLPVNRSSEGDTQSCCIMICTALKNCIEGTAPTSWSGIDSHTPPLGLNHGFCCWCQNWRRVYRAMLPSARQTKRKIIDSLLIVRPYSRF